MKTLKLTILFFAAGLLTAATGTPANFIYPDTATSSGGQYNALYPPSNLMNNGFTDPSNTISTITDYLAANNSYATASGTTKNFNLVFDFAVPTALDGMHVWNYAYRNGTNGAVSPNFGVNAYTLTFYSEPGGAGSVIGSVFTNALAAATWNASNPAESVYFGVTNANVRSVVMRVLSNHGGGFTGMNELAFNGIASGAAPTIDSFGSSVPFAQRPAALTLNWSIGGEISSLSISPGIGDVTTLTTNGTGSVAISPLGEQTYTLTLNGTIQQTVSVVGLPPKEKLHIYLFIGQSNMHGVGTPYNDSLDAPNPRVIKFGSRDGMESIFVKGGHPLTALTSSAGSVGMGVEFGKTLLASQTDPEVVICLINHALGSSAIQWWAPGVIDNKQTNSLTGQNYHLYDEAVQRVNSALNYGVLKGVLWHQGEYNSNSNTDPDSDPGGYAARLQTLVDNLRTSFSNSALPFVCGKFVPASWVTDAGTTNYFTGLPDRAVVEAALTDLPNQRNNTFCVDNAGLRGRADQLIHFDAYSQRLLGQRYAAAMKTFYADPYRLYLGGFLSPAEMQDTQLTNPLGDNDHDGLVNFLEYAFHQNPAVPETVPPITLSAHTIPPALSYLQRTDTEAPVYTVEFSTNLVTWESNSNGLPPVTEAAELPVDHGNGSATVTVRPLNDSPTGFFRIRVNSL